MVSSGVCEEAIQISHLSARNMVPPDTPFICHKGANETTRGAFPVKFDYNQMSALMHELFYRPSVCLSVRSFVREPSYPLLFVIEL